MRNTKRLINSQQPSASLLGPLASGIVASNISFLAYCGAYIALWQRLNVVSDKSLAESIGCHPATIWKLKNGKDMHVSLVFLSRVALATGADLITMVQEGIELVNARNA